VSTTPTPEQHRALLADALDLAAQLPDSGVLDSGGKPYRALRYERAVNARADDPAGLLDYIKSIAHRKSSEGLTALVKYGRLDLSVETLVVDTTKVYAPLFSADDRAAAQAKLDLQAGQIEELARGRKARLNEEDRATIRRMNQRRAATGRPVLTPEQEASVLENRRRGRGS
jgi:hypothetical protein